MFHQYSEALDYLYERLPMFQRIGAAAYKSDLSNTLALCGALGHPEKKIRTIHVAGTNGKGSSSHMLAAVLMKAGYTVGLYTSPHLKNFTERIRVNGEEVPPNFVLEFVNTMKTHIEAIKPSFFETTVAMAFEYFALRKVDIAVIEVGLGGRLDSTNVIAPIVSLITNISFDHKDILGDTLGKIAHEKAGIIKSHTPVVVSERQAEVDFVFEEEAALRHAPIFFASDAYQVKRKEDGAFSVVHHQKTTVYTLDLKGIYQTKNLPGVLQVLALLTSLGFNVSEQNIIDGLAQVVVLTGLKGRWQRLSNAPKTYCDVGHNEAGITEVLKTIAQEKYRSLHIVWGMVKDKDYAAILALLPPHAHYYFCHAAGSPRALPAQALQETAQPFGLQGEAYPSVNAAYLSAVQRAALDDLIWVGGSTFIVSELDNL